MLESSDHGRGLLDGYISQIERDSNVSGSMNGELRCLQQALHYGKQASLCGTRAELNGRPYLRFAGCGYVQPFALVVPLTG